MIVTGIVDCMPGCSESTAAVSVTDAARDLLAVQDACRGAGGEGRLCEDGRITPIHAMCVDQECIACGELACENGVHVPMPFWKTRVERFIQVTVDGQVSACRAPPDGAWVCSGPLVMFSLTEQLVWELFLPTATAKVISIRVTEDGTEIGNKTFQPKYQLSPGPNGPKCEPKQCYVATETFP